MKFKSVRTIHNKEYAVASFIGIINGKRDYVISAVDEFNWLTVPKAKSLIKTLQKHIDRIEEHKLAREALEKLK